MKRIVASTGAALIAASSMMISSADAGANGGRHHRHHHHHGARLGFFVGAPLIASPWWHHNYYGYGPYPYYAPPVVVREEPTVYIEQTAQPAPQPAPQAQAPQQYWYFCQNTQTYYPHVQTCASPWQRVIPHAPPQQ